MPSFQAPRGMRDLLPEEAAAFDALQAVIEARALRYGYPRIATPIVEDRGVFAKSVGEASDIVGYEMYDVSLHGQGGMVLRPEGTAAVHRRHSILMVLILSPIFTPSTTSFPEVS